MMINQAIQPSRIKNRITNEFRETSEAVGKIVILDFLVGISMMAAGVPIFGTFPVSIFAIAILCIVAIQRKSKYEVKYLSLFLMINIFALIWVLAVSLIFNDIPLFNAIKRAARIILLFFFVALIADKRIDFRSFIIGMGLGLSINAIAFYAGVAPDDYGGALTGWLQDKNKAGIFYAVGGLLVFTQLNKKWHKIIAFIIFSGFLWSTGSRTSMGAFMFGILWLIFAHRLNLFFKVFLAAFVAWGIDYLTINFSQAGVFANREGSDFLRERIDEAAQMKLADSPWYGQGLGTATVDLTSGTFFFHNSFWTLLVEGGWIYLFLIASSMILAGFIWKQKNGNKILYAEAGIVMLAICGWRLGEVFLTESWALVMGLALLLFATPKDRCDQNSHG